MSDCVLKIDLRTQEASVVQGFVRLVHEAAFWMDKSQPLTSTDAVVDWIRDRLASGRYLGLQFYMEFSKTRAEDLLSSLRDLGLPYVLDQDMWAEDLPGLVIRHRIWMPGFDHEITTLTNEDETFVPPSEIDRILTADPSGWDAYKRDLSAATAFEPGIDVPEEMLRYRPIPRP